MSTLTVSNISDGTTTVAASYVTNGSAKAWVNLNGTGTIAIRDSLNVSSLTDINTGDYRTNISNSMGNANYAISANASFDNGGFTGQQNAQPAPDQAPTTGSYRVVTSNSSNANIIDAQKVYSKVHGDLA